MVREDTHPEDEREAIEGIYTKLDTLADKLLTDSVRHTDVWKRSKFSIDSEKTNELYRQVKNSPLRSLFDKREGFVGSEHEIGVMDTSTPTEAVIVVEKFGPYPGDGYQYKQLKIFFVYRHHPNERMYYLGIGINTNSHQSISSFIFQPDLYETGYEGTDHKSIEGNYENVKFLYELFEQNTQENQLKEEAFEDQLVKQKMVNMDTGESYYYDPKRRAYFNKSDVSMDNDNAPLEKIPSKNPRLKVKAEYITQELEEGEKNPFV